MALRTEVERWLEKEGMGFLEQVVYGKMTPHQAAEGFIQGLRVVVAEAEASQ